MIKHILDKVPLATNNGINVYSCLSCGFAHVHPYEIDPGYYTDDVFYREHAPADWFEKERREYDAGLWDAAFAFRSELLKRYSGYGYLRVIDYGCGSGIFTDYYTRRHLLYSTAIAIGYEVSATARSYAPSPYMIVDDLNSPALQDYNRYGVKGSQSVVLSLVLEHIPEAIDWFKLAIDPLVSDNGCVLIVAPNEFNPLQKALNNRVMDAHRDWFVQKPHVNYFSKDGIVEFVNRVGYRVVYQGATFPMELFGVLGKSYIGNDELGRRYFSWKMRFERLLGGAAFNLYSRLYNRYGIGRESIIVAKK